MRPTTPRPARRTQTIGRAQVVAGMPTILVGFVCYPLTNAFDGGFFRGLFQGATIALMVLGAYLTGAGLWFLPQRRRNPAQRGTLAAQ